MRVSVNGVKKILTIVVGAAQSTLGVLAVIFACFLYIDFFGLNVTADLLHFQTLVLVVFGFFSIISGLFLLTEREKSP